MAVFLLVCLETATKMKTLLFRMIPLHFAFANGTVSPGISW